MVMITSESFPTATRSVSSRFTPVLVGALALTVCLTGCMHSYRGSTDQPTATTRKGPRGTRPYTIKGKTYHPLLHAHGFKEHGVASWYGPDFHGKMTANGERYDMYSMTAAHKLLPFGTQVRVTNKKNGKSIVVRINDRGPFIDDRIIDLSHTGAHKLGILGPGTAPVFIQSIGTVASTPSGDLKGTYYVQLGAFSRKTNAAGVVENIKKQGGNARFFFDQTAGLWRAQAGPFSSLSAANTASGKFKRQFPHNFVAAE